MHFQFPFPFHFGAMAKKLKRYYKSGMCGMWRNVVVRRYMKPQENNNKFFTKSPGLFVTLNASTFRVFCSKV